MRDFAAIWEQWKALGLAYQAARKDGRDQDALAIADQIVTMVQPDLLKQVLAKRAGGLLEQLLSGLGQGGRG